MQYTATSQPQRPKLGREVTLIWSEEWGQAWRAAEQTEGSSDLLWEGPLSWSRNSGGAKIRGHWEELNLVIKAPCREEGSSVPSADVPPCLQPRGPVGGSHYVTFPFLQIFQSLCSDVQVQVAAWVRPAACWERTRPAPAPVCWEWQPPRVSRLCRTFMGARAGFAQRKVYQMGPTWNLKLIRIFAWAGLILSATTEGPQWTKLWLGDKKSKGNTGSHCLCPVEASTWTGTYSLSYSHFLSTCCLDPKPVPLILSFCYRSNYCCITTPEIQWPTTISIYHSMTVLAWGPAALAGLSDAVLLEAAGLAGLAPSLQGGFLSAPCGLVLGLWLKGQRLPRRTSYRGDGRDLRGKLKCTSTLQAPTCVLSINSPFAKESHVTEPEFRGEEVHFVSLGRD